MLYCLRMYSERGEIMAKRRPEVKYLSTATMLITLSEDQEFYENPKSWEIWNTNPLQRVKRIDKKRIFWVGEK